MRAAETENAELAAADITPGEAIMAGFSMVAADNPALGETIRAAARAAAAEFRGLVSSFEDGSRERKYVSELLMCAVSFAAGLARRQAERAHRVEAAEQERALNFKRIVQTQRTSGILKGGVQLLLLGGFAYAIVKTIIGIKVLEGEATKLDAQYASLATAMASALIGSFIKAWWTGRSIGQVDRHYKDALREAKCIYAVEARQEYELAAQEANLAWQKFTGKKPPMTDAFRVLVLGLLAGDEAVEASAPA